MSLLSARLPVYILLVLAWTAPYLVSAHTYPIPTFYSEFTALMLYALLAASVAWAAFDARPGFTVAIPRVALLPLALAVLLVCQPLLLPTMQASMNLLGAGFLLAAVLAAATGFNLARLGLAARASRVVAFALLVGGVLAFLCQVVQLFHLEARFAPLVVPYNIHMDRRPFGNMAQANHLASYLMFGLAGALFLVQTGRLNRWLWGAVSAILCLGAALTVSRTPWLQVGVVALAGLLMQPLRGVRNAASPDAADTSAQSENGVATADADANVNATARRKLLDRWLAPVLLLAIFVLMNLVLRWANVRFHLQLAESAAERFQDAGQISPRLALWRYGLAMFRAHPWFGVGWGEFPWHQYLLAGTLGKVEIANNSHDIVIDLLAKTGLIGSVLVWGGLAAWLWRAVRAPYHAYRVFALAILAVLGVHALVEYPQQYMFFLLPAAFLIGLVEPGLLRIPGPARAWWTYCGLTLAAVLALVPVFNDYRRAEVLYYGSQPGPQYRANPARIFFAWSEYGLATIEAINNYRLPNKLAMHRQAISLLPGETVLRRYAALLALDGQEAMALDVVRRLNLFAQALHDWPAQLDALYALCDEQPKALAPFRRDLRKHYGVSNTPPKGDADDD